VLQRLLDSVWFVSTVLVGTLGIQQFANAQDADWRVFGFTDKLTLFYSVPDIARAPDGSVRVWTQGIQIKEKALDAAAKDKIFLDLVAGRIAHYYVPPLALVEKINTDQMMNLVQMEEVANERRVSPDIVMFTEIDCKDLRSRFLQITKYAKDGTLRGTKTQPWGWEYIQPQTNNKKLATLVCDPSLTAPDNTPVARKAPAK